MRRAPGEPLRAILTILLSTTLVSGCAGNPATPPAETASLTSTVGDPLPAGIRPAYIVEVNGERVHFARRIVRVEPGPVTVRVFPWIDGPPDLIPVKAAPRFDEQSLPLTLDAKAGHTYYIGVRMLEPFDDLRKQHGVWVPAVVQITGRDTREPLQYRQPLILPP